MSSLAENLAERVATAVDNCAAVPRGEGSQPAKGRVSGHAGPRAAQSAGGHPLRRRAGADVATAIRPSELFEIIDRQTQNLAHLIDDLLDVSRISRDKVTLRKEHDRRGDDRRPRGGHGPAADGAKDTTS